MVYVTPQLPKALYVANPVTPFGVTGFAPLIFIAAIISSEDIPKNFFFIGCYVFKGVKELRS